MTSLTVFILLPVFPLACSSLTLYIVPFSSSFLHLHLLLPVLSTTPLLLFLALPLSLRDLEGAAEAAIERRSEGEINTVLSRCSPTTDRALVEKLNRARATAAKK